MVTLICQIPGVLLEAAPHDLLRDEPDIRASRLLYHPAPVLKPDLNPKHRSVLQSRRLFVIERATSVNRSWKQQNSEDKACTCVHPICSNLTLPNSILLNQLARMRALLFNYIPPSEFPARYLFDFKPRDSTASHAKVLPGHACALPMPSLVSSLVVI